MGEVVRSLEDLRRVVAFANEHGECMVELPDGSAFVLIPASEAYDNDLDPTLVQALERALTQSERNLGITTKELLVRLSDRRDKSHG